MPRLIGDQTVFCVFNDLAGHTEYGTAPLNAEVKQTVWAYDRIDALGDMIFIKWQIVNKGDFQWDSTYFGLWFDPDLGDAGDDFVGSDSSLNLAFCYNATNHDSRYGDAPPALGIVFFQGSVVDESGSIFQTPDGTIYPDKKDIGLSSFLFYNADDSPIGNPQNARDVWYFLQARWRNGVHVVEGGSGYPYYVPFGEKTCFMFSGDPETGTGWLDQNKSDRRFYMGTGPFYMPVWEDSNNNCLPDFGEPGVQEIVAAVVCARGETNVNSVTRLKKITRTASVLYKADFNMGQAPKTPELTIGSLANEVILTWDDRSEYNSDGSPYLSTDPFVADLYGKKIYEIVGDDTTKKIFIDDSTYNFYGYCVFQYLDAEGHDPVEIWRSHIYEPMEAKSYADIRFLRIKEQTLSTWNIGEVDLPLINGKEYYFGIVAEGYLKYGKPTIISSEPAIVTAVPQAQPGVRYSVSFNDTVAVAHQVIDSDTPPSDGSVTVKVIDPSRTTGLDYMVTFNADLSWNLIRSLEDTIVSHQKNQTGNDAYNVVDGLMVKVQGHSPGINLSIEGPYGDYPGAMGYNQSGGTRWFSWPRN
jgi:hypothetical protein